MFGLAEKKNKINPIDYLYFFAIFFVFLGCNITIIFYIKAKTTNILLLKKDWILLLPTFCFNTLSFFMASFFAFIKSKDLFFKSSHFKKKWVNFYLASFILYVMTIVFTSTFCVVIKNNFIINWDFKFLKIILLVYFIFCFILTLTTIFLQKYAQFKIDFDIDQKKSGHDVDQKATK